MAKASMSANRRSVTPTPIVGTGVILTLIVTGALWFAFFPVTTDDGVTFQSRLAAIVEDDATDLAERDLAPELGAQVTAAEAIEQYAAIVAADPGDHVTLSKLASTEQLLGRASEAITHLEAAIKVEPAPSYYEALAPIYASVGKWSECIDAWTAYIALTDLDPVAEGKVRAAIASAYEGMREYDKAKAELELAISLDPENEHYRSRMKDYGN